MFLYHFICPLPFAISHSLWLPDTVFNSNHAYKRNERKNKRTRHDIFAWFYFVYLFIYVYFCLYVLIFLALMAMNRQNKSFSFPCRPIFFFGGRDVCLFISIRLSLFYIFFLLSFSTFFLFILGEY